MRPSSEERDKINLPREGSIAPKQAIFGAEETNFLSRHSSFSILKSSPSLRRRHASLGMKSWSNSTLPLSAEA